MSGQEHRLRSFDTESGYMESAEQQINQKTELFEKKLLAQAELYRLLLTLARKQAEEILTENVDAFVLLLEEKRKIVGEIEEIETAAEPLRRFWEAHKDEVGESVRARLRAVVDETRGLLEELLELESQSQRKLGVTKDALQEQIRQLSAGPQAMHSYARKPDQKPRFMDQTG